MNKQKDPLAEFLRLARIEAGLSQRNVSAKLGYQTPQFISMWERGVSLPPGRSLRAIAELYKIDTSVLYELLVNRATSRLQESLHREVYGSSLESAG
jgi:transcriptional regulator with XRE-family HTH domain